MKTTLKGVLLLAAMLLAVSTAQAASITVDAGGVCALADAITAANTDATTGGCPAGSGADIITLQKDVTLTATMPQITTVITIEGGDHFISGNKSYRVLEVNSGGNLTVNQATIKEGMIDIGAGIYNNGAVTLTNCTVSDNTASMYGGGIYNGYDSIITLTNSTVSGNTVTVSDGEGGIGGGIYNDGAVMLTNCTVSGNMASMYGGGICNENGGIVTLTNSTISGNTVSDGEGGGIYNGYDGSTITLNNSTVSGNTVSSSGGGISNMYGGIVTLTNSTISGNTVSDGEGGGICNASFNGIAGSMVILRSSIISGNNASSGKEIYRYYSTITANSYNVFGHSGETSAQAFIGFTPGTSDVNATIDGTNRPLDSILLPLASNGGPTKTHALVANSPAINLDGACSAGMSTDQRGTARLSTGCDAGAYEYVASTSINLVPMYELLLRKR